MSFKLQNHEILSSERLLPDEEEVDLNRGVFSVISMRWIKVKGEWSLWALLHLTLICIYSTVLIGFIIAHPNLSTIETAHQLPLSAREALRPELRYFPTKLEGNPFAGGPRPELEVAWHDLLQNDNIRLPRKDLDDLQLHSVYTRDGSEGIASLGVFHSLHCLKLVRRMIYKEHYHGNKSDTEMARQMKHADHCIEYLRESLMCKPDISPVTFRWINNTAQHPDEPSAFYPTNFDASHHECMNWELLNDWAGERVFDLYDVELLDRPHM